MNGDDGVRRLLADFAEQATGDAAMDADADVARGQRALRLLRMRRTTGVLVVAAAAGAVVATGGPANWWSGHGADVASDAATEGSATPSAIQPYEVPASSGQPTLELGTPMVASAGTTVVLVRNTAKWPGISCGLAPSGWNTRIATAQTVVLAAPAGAAARGKIELRTADAADRLLQVSAVRAPGRLVFLGLYASGDRGAQLKQGDSWVILRVPRGQAGWADPVVVRLMASCAPAGTPATR